MIHKTKALSETPVHETPVKLAATGLGYCVAANDEMRGTLICFSRLRVWAMS